MAQGAHVTAQWAVVESGHTVDKKSQLKLSTRPRIPGHVSYILKSQGNSFGNMKNQKVFMTVLMRLVMVPQHFLGWAL